jgi:hypothetical protein
MNKNKIPVRRIYDSNEFFGPGVQPGEYPFILVNGTGTFTEFQAALPRKMREAIGMSSFFGGLTEPQYNFADTNGFNGPMDKDDFIIDIPWLIESGEYELVAIELIEWMQSYPKLSKYTEISLHNDPRWEKYTKRLNELCDEEFQISKRDLTFAELAKEDEEARALLEKRRKVKEDLIAEGPVMAVVKLLKSWCERGQAWIDKYEGRSDEDFRVTIR